MSSCCSPVLATATRSHRVATTRSAGGTAWIALDQLTTMQRTYHRWIMEGITDVQLPNLTLFLPNLTSLAPQVTITQTRLKSIVLTYITLIVVGFLLAAVDVTDSIVIVYILTGGSGVVRWTLAHETIARYVAHSFILARIILTGSLPTGRSTITLTKQRSKCTRS